MSNTIKKSNAVIAYFSMEFGIESYIKTYCGGLGILAGDTIKTAADNGINMFGVSILHKHGWFKQSIGSDFQQVESPDLWDYKKELEATDITFEMVVGSEVVKVIVWKYVYLGKGGNTSTYFLDTDVDGNSEFARNLSMQVYPPDQNLWFSQQVLLGIGGFKLVEILGISVTKYHLNESHACSLILALYQKFGDWDKVREHLVFTTHTPLETAHQKMSLETLGNYLSNEYIELIPKDILEADGRLNFTTLSVFAAGFSNGVAQRHGEVTQKMYPNYKINFVTNGAHMGSWVGNSMKVLYDKYLPGWEISPHLLRQIDRISDEELSLARLTAKQELMDLINDQGKAQMSVDKFTIGFARRAVPYKRANLILMEFDRLQKIATKYGGLQIVFSGKAYPTDTEGKKLLQQIIQSANGSDMNLNIVFLENYNMDVAKKIINGVDLWLNNPLPPLEASGTSGMKASLCGVPNFSILDGWWVEGHLEGQTGWSIGTDLCEGDMCRIDEVKDLYTKLENDILLAWQDKADWNRIRKASIAINGSYFNTQRMLNEYLLKAYLV